MTWWLQSSCLGAGVTDPYGGWCGDACGPLGSADPCLSNIPWEPPPPPGKIPPPPFKHPHDDEGKLVAGLGGACCSSCAGGGACETKCDGGGGSVGFAAGRAQGGARTSWNQWKKTVPLRGNLTASYPFGQGGGPHTSYSSQTEQPFVTYQRTSPPGRVGALYISDKQIADMAEQVNVMSADVDAAAKAEAATFADRVSTGAAMTACRAAGLKWDVAGDKCLQEPDPSGLSYKQIPDAGAPLTEFQTGDWTPFALKWNTFAQSTVHFPSDYDALVVEFKRLLGRWTTELHQQTRAKVPASAAPKEWWEDLPWGWIVLGGAVVVLPFALPALTGLYLAVTKGKALLPLAKAAV